MPRGHLGKYRDPVTDHGWSPADEPYAVAVPEANAWKQAIDLCAYRMRGGGPDAQIDARLFLLALRLLLRTQSMASKAVKTVPAAAQLVNDARRNFDEACPDAKGACDMIEHFGEYALGTGDLQSNVRDRNKRSIDRVAAARDWSLDYDQTVDRIRLGLTEIDVAMVCQHAKLLQHSIWAAARAFENATP
jgi:hypothetical protein